LIDFEIQKVVQSQNSKERALSVHKICFSFKAFCLNWQYIINYRGVYYVIHCSQVYLSSIHHRQYLPAISSVSWYPSELCSSVEFHVVHYAFMEILRHLGTTLQNYFVQRYALLIFCFIIIVLLILLFIIAIFVIILLKVIVLQYFFNIIFFEICLIHFSVK
jgi:hypothetical protein